MFPLARSEFLLKKQASLVRSGDMGVLSKLAVLREDGLLCEKECKPVVRSRETIK